MRRLILLRHAKSSWADPELADHDRPLNARGRLAAPLIGAWLADRDARPTHVICSSSLRAQQTWARAHPAFRDAPAPRIEPRLYHAAPATMLELLREAPKDADCLMMIGHQPGIGSFTRKLAGKDTPRACARAYEKFPTAAAALLEFDIKDWGKAAFGAGRFTAFAVPRELV